MFHRKIVISPNDYIELSSRIHDGQDKVLCSIVALSGKDELVSVGLVLSEEQLATLAMYSKDALSRDKTELSSLPEA